MNDFCRKYSEWLGKTVDSAFFSSTKIRVLQPVCADVVLSVCIPSSVLTNFQISPVVALSPLFTMLSLPDSCAGESRTWAPIMSSSILVRCATTGLTFHGTAVS